MEYFASTDIGKIRKNNEDSFKAEPPFFIIADGMGGHNAGEIASKIAVDIISRKITANEHIDLAQIVKTAVEEANLSIFNSGDSDRELKGMGTTVDICYFSGKRLVIGHVGDSRVYKFTNGDLNQLTNDHSVVEILLRSGSITPKQAENYPNKNMITRALGAEKDVDVDIYDVTVNNGDVILMCSDGLTSMVSDTVIREIISNNKEPKDMVQNLIQKALDNGGQDNVTVIIIKVVD